MLSQQYVSCAHAEEYRLYVCVCVCVVDWVHVRTHPHPWAWAVGVSASLIKLYHVLCAEKVRLLAYKNTRAYTQDNNSVRASRIFETTMLQSRFLQPAFVRDQSMFDVYHVCGYSASDLDALLDSYYRIMAPLERLSMDDDYGAATATATATATAPEQKKPYDIAEAPLPIDYGTSSTDDVKSQSSGDASSSGVRRYMQRHTQAIKSPYHSGEALYKTELCRNHAEGRVCKYGRKCQFAHGETELREIVRHPQFKSANCRSFHNNGICKYGSRCTFIH